VRGIVRWFNGTKGYGFIGRENGPDVFVHFTSVIGEGFRTLRDGDVVEFEIGQGPRGAQAVQVRKASGESVGAGEQSKPSKPNADPRRSRESRSR
jgi:cold shock protein